MKREACRSCGATVEWAKTANGKSTPMDLDGTPHWARCPQAATWRRGGKDQDQDKPVQLDLLKKATP